MVDPVAPSQSQPAARPVVIRLAIESDRMAIFKLCLAMHAETDFGNYALDPEMTIHGIGMWLGSDERRVMHVAEKNGVVIGMLATVVGHAWFGQEVTLRDEIFYVDPAYRGGRAAYLLMQQFMARAKAVQAKHLLSGNTSGVSDAAERLYQHFGMRRTGGNYCLHT